MMGRRHAAAWLRGLSAALSLCAVLATAVLAESRLKIETLSLFVAEPGSTAELDVRVGPPAALPKNAYIRIRGLPPQATLSDSFVVTPGVWSVPLAALGNLRVTLPKGVSGRSELTISVHDVDGKVLAETRSALVVAQVNLRSTLAPEPKPEVKLPPKVELKPDPPKPDVPKAEPPKVEPPKVEAPKLLPKPAPVIEATPQPEARPEPRPEPKPERTAKAALAPSPPAPAIPPPLSPEARQRNQRMIEQGDKAIGLGNIATARQFYLRAADAGDGAAALKLAETYDPVELARLDARGIVGDVAEAKRWYERARDLGVAIAADKLSRLARR